MEGRAALFSVLDRDRIGSGGRGRAKSYITRDSFCKVGLVEAMMVCTPHTGVPTVVQLKLPANEGTRM